MLSITSPLFINFLGTSWTCNAFPSSVTIAALYVPFEAAVLDVLRCPAISLSFLRIIISLKPCRGPFGSSSINLTII